MANSDKLYSVELGHTVEKTALCRACAVACAEKLTQDTGNDYSIREEFGEQEFDVSKIMEALPPKGAIVLGANGFEIREGEDYDS